MVISTLKHLCQTRSFEYIDDLFTTHLSGTDLQHLVQLLSVGSYHDASQLLVKCCNRATVGTKIDFDKLQEELVSTWVDTITKVSGFEAGIKEGRGRKWDDLIPTPSVIEIGERAKIPVSREDEAYDHFEDTSGDGVDRLTAMVGVTSPVILAWGPPCSAKTVAAEALPSLLKEHTGAHYNLISFNFDSMKDSLLGNSESKMRYAIAMIKSISHSVIVWDEALKSLLPGVQASKSEGVTGNLVGMLITALSHDIPAALLAHGSILILTANEAEVRSLAQSEQGIEGLVRRVFKGNVHTEIMDDPLFYRQFFENDGQEINSWGTNRLQDLAGALQTGGYYQIWAEALNKLSQDFLRLYKVLELRRTLGISDQRIAGNFGSLNHDVLRSSILEGLRRIASKTDNLGQINDYMLHNIIGGLRMEPSAGA